MPRVKFNTKNKGTIGQLFGGNAKLYQGRQINGHNGIDSLKGWNALIVADNDGYVYKTISSNQSSENWQGVYMLVPVSDDTFIEVCQGHFNEILVKEGDSVIENQPIGKEGNKGFVFFNTLQITPEMQRNGDKRGAHTHTSYRPVERVKKTEKGEYYLLTVTGQKYKDKNGYFYRIIHKDNGYKGCVDPMNYKYTNSIKENLAVLTKQLLSIKKQYDF